MLGMPCGFVGVLAVATIAAGSAPPGSDVERLIEQVRAVGPQGAGSAQARAARDQLAKCGPEILPALLRGMDTPDLVAANWLRTAFDEIVRRARQDDPRSIPAAELTAFVRDAARQGRVRRLALDLLTQLDPGTPGRLIPPLLDDAEFRRDAVAVALAEGDRAKEQQRRDAAVAAYRKAFDAARDADQVRSAATQLRTLGHEVDIVEHLGFVVDWHVIGPFDAPEYQAFARVYPPEQELQLSRSYPGKGGAVSWKRHRTPDEFGTVDLVKALAPVDDAAAYLYTRLDSPAERAVQLRAGADDNLTIWLNGRKVFAKDEWQNGTRLDRFIVPVQLRQGPNDLLVKVCQGPKYRDPGMANPWSLQIRVCDAGGKGVVLRP
jgi:hypothetical protein